MKIFSQNTIEIQSKLKFCVKAKAKTIEIEIVKSIQH